MLPELSVATNPSLPIHLCFAKDFAGNLRGIDKTIGSNELMHLANSAYLDTHQIGTKTYDVPKLSSLPAQLKSLQSRLKIPDSDFKTLLSNSIVGYTDVKGLKNINHKYGYQAGTQNVLLQFAALQNTTRENTNQEPQYHAIVARCPEGDEFLTIFVPHHPMAKLHPSKLEENFHKEKNLLLSELTDQDPLFEVASNDSSSISCSMHFKKMSEIEIPAHHNRYLDIIEAMITAVEAGTEPSHTRSAKKATDVLTSLIDRQFNPTPNELDSVEPRVSLLKEYVPEKYLELFNSLFNTDSHTSQNSPVYLTQYARIFEEIVFNTQFCRDIPVLSENIWKQNLRNYDHLAMISPEGLKTANKTGRAQGTKMLLDTLKQIKNVLPENLLKNLKNHLQITKIGGSFYLLTSTECNELLSESFDNREDSIYTYTSLPIDKSGDLSQLEYLRLIHYNRERKKHINSLSNRFLNQYLERPASMTPSILGISKLEHDLRISQEYDLDFDPMQHFINLIKRIRGHKS